MGRPFAVANRTSAIGGVEGHASRPSPAAFRTFLIGLDDREDMPHRDVENIERDERDYEDSQSTGAAAPSGGGRLKRTPNPVSPASLVHRPPPVVPNAARRRRFAPV